MWIDAHIHLFDIDRPETQWPTPKHPAVLYRSSRPSDFSQIARDTNIEMAVCVECVSGDKHEDENNLWTFELTKNAAQIGAVIGSIPLDSDVFEEVYERYISYPKFRGIRIRPDLPIPRINRFEENLRFFKPEANVVEIVPAHFSNLYVVEPMIARNPQILFVIDHFAWFTTDGNPPSAGFLHTLRDIAVHTNTAIKLSGLFERSACRPCSTEREYYFPLLTAVVDAFGLERCMFGSDWPPCAMFGSYQDQVEYTAGFLSRFGKQAVESVMGGNARRIYRIEQEEDRNER